MALESKAFPLLLDKMDEIHDFFKFSIGQVFNLSG